VSSGSADRRESADFSCDGIGLKVILPGLLARMKKGSFDLSRRIIATGSVSFAEVARTTGEGKVRVVVAALFRDGNDVFDLEGEVKDEFWSVAVFASVFGSIGNQGVGGIHELQDGRWVLAFSLC
jgi:hypothetical protein